jgi:aerobic-type carbon monoxide dehydrogenase small subunit (CoxS/CutS family)
MDAVGGQQDAAAPAAQPRDTEPADDPAAAPDGYQDDGLSDNAPSTTRLRPSRPPRRPLQDTRVQEPLPERPSELTTEFFPPGSPSPERPSELTTELFPPAAPDGGTPAAPADADEPGAGEPPAQDVIPQPPDADGTDDADPEGAEAAEPVAESPKAPADTSGPAHPSSGTHTPDSASGTPEPLAESALADVTGAQEPPDADHDPAADASGEPLAAEPSEDDPEPDAAFADEHPLASYVLRVNGSDRPVTGAWIGESLLYVLRERLGLAGAKDGCSQGECGACNVQVDGRLVASCLVPAVTAAGSEVRTVEGLARDGQPSDVQRALAECGAVQCGFCVPGMAMTVHDLLEGNPHPTPLEARKALAGNLCRCSAYRGVLDAVDKVAAERRATAEAEEEAAHNAHAEQADRSVGPRIPHQAGPGDAEAAEYGEYTEDDDVAYATTQAQYRDAAPEPYSYEDDGYDDGGRV